MGTSPRKPASSEPEPAETVEAEDDTEVTPAVSSDAVGDNVGDISVEVNVEELIAQLEAESGAPMNGHTARRRIEDILEDKRVAREIMDFDDYDIDD